MRTWLALLGLGLLSSCTYDDTFSACPLSKKTIETCTSDGSALLSCVVRDHPQCSEDVCLSWKGGESRCTRSCDPALKDCPEGSTCAAYTEIQSGGGEYFCVQNEFLGPTSTVSGSN